MNKHLNSQTLVLMISSLMIIGSFAQDPIDLTQLKGGFAIKLANSNDEYNVAVSIPLQFNAFFVCQDDETFQNPINCDDSEDCEIFSDNNDYKGYFFGFQGEDAQEMNINFKLPNDNSVSLKENTGIVQYCEGTFSQNKSYSHYSGFSGVVGLSTKSPFYQETFGKAKNKFALYFPQHDTPRLLFDHDESYLNRKEPIQTFGAGSVGENWEVGVSRLAFNSRILPEATKMIFDPNVNYVGIYYQEFKKIIDILSDDFGIDCVNNVYATCSNRNGDSIDVDSLPDLKIKSDSMLRISIPARAYLKQTPGGGPNNLTLFLVGISRNEETVHVYVDEQYDDYLIVGTPYLNGKYILFDNNYDDPQITIYEGYKHPIRILGHNFSWTWIIAFLVIAAILCILLQRQIKRRNLKAQASRYLQGESSLLIYESFEKE